MLSLARWIRLAVLSSGLVFVMASSASAQTFKRGDADGNGCVDALDATYIQNFLFVPGSPPPTCFDAADANDDGAVNNPDALYILTWVTVAGSPPPPAPGPSACGADPTADALGCGSYLACADGCFKRGDANGDGCVDALDATFIQNFLFVPGSPPPACFDGADANDDGVIDNSDALYILSFLTVPGSPPPPFPGELTCSGDPTPDALSCVTYTACAASCAPPFKRGDADGNGCVENADAIFIQNFLFMAGSPAPPCMDAADANDDGAVDNSDALLILNALLIPGSPTPPAPGPEVCGPDPTADALGCATYVSCLENCFKRGDADQNGYVSAADATFIQNFLFMAGAPAPACFDSADANDDGIVDNSDALFILNFVTVPGSPPPPLPTGMCGSDPTVDLLDCVTYVQCENVFIRGDADSNGVFNGVVDGVFLLNYAFVPGSPVPGCLDTVDCDDDGTFNGIVDGIFLLSFAFIPGSPTMPPPYPLCGVDPPGTSLGCLVQPTCP